MRPMPTCFDAKLHLFQGILYLLGVNHTGSIGLSWSGGWHSSKASLLSSERTPLSAIIGGGFLQKWLGKKLCWGITTSKAIGLLWLAVGMRASKSCVISLDPGFKWGIISIFFPEMLLLVWDFLSMGFFSKIWRHYFCKHCPDQQEQRGKEGKKKRRATPDLPHQHCARLRFLTVIGTAESRAHPTAEEW